MFFSFLFKKIHNFGESPQYGVSLFVVVVVVVVVVKIFCSFPSPGHDTRAPLGLRFANGSAFGLAALGKTL